MKCIEDLSSDINTPRLIPSYKQTERRLLSVFMSLLELSPAIRGRFLAGCGFKSARTSAYQSFMEVTYKGSKYSEARPDGLIVCSRGKTVWSAFIEAKADKKTIRAEQIQEYAKLADVACVDAIISISNEFARASHELPYTLAQNKRKSKDIFHFAWADVRTFLELERSQPDLSDAERYVLNQCLTFLWEDGAGVLTYDAMPEVWPAFVEASSTALGFNSNIKGFSEIIYGWQQERRDLCSKLTHRLGDQVSLLHVAGVRAGEDERLNADRKSLSEEYILTARYRMDRTRTVLDLIADLRACRITGAIDVPIPENKGSKAIATWLAKAMQDVQVAGLQLVFDWPGTKHDKALSLPEFLAEPGLICEQRRDAPRSIRAVFSQHGVRRFKSRKLFIEDVEQVTHCLVDLSEQAGWLG